MSDNRKGESPMDVPTMVLDRKQTLDLLGMAPQCEDHLWRAAESGGIKVLDLHTVSRSMELFPSGWPRLAIAQR